VLDLVLSALLLAGSGLDRPQLPAPPPPPPPPIQRDIHPSEQKTGRSAIRGRVTSADTGKPLRRAQVYLSGADASESRRVSTNTAGRYEIKDLPAGRYTVRVMRSGYLPLAFGQRRPGEAGKPIELADGQAADNIDFALPRTSVITGRVIDELGEPVADAQVFALRPQFFQGRRRLVPFGGPGARSDDTGQYRLLALPAGDYLVMASLRETWPLDDDPKQVFGYAPSYYPGTASPADAQRVKVALGQETGAIDIQLVPGRTATLSGIALSSSGAPMAGQSVGLSLEVRGPTIMSTMGVASTKTGPDGSWTLRNVQPGEYRLSVRSAGDQPEQADMMVALNGVDMEGVTLVAGPGGTVRGVIVTEDNAPLAPPLDRLTVRSTSVGAEFANRFQAPPGVQNGRVDSDGGFELKVAPGATLLTVAPLPPSWSIKAVELEGRDIADTPVDIRHGQMVAGVRIVLTNRSTIVRGVILAERSREPVDGTVIVFAADSTKWFEGSRMVRTARPDQQGRFELRNLPPGDYLAVGLEYVEEGQWNDPEFLDGLKLRAERLTLAENETRQVDLVARR
jgi:protocatechuate 3,4-dioxygenase beta subunit